MVQEESKVAVSMCGRTENDDRLQYIIFQCCECERDSDGRAEDMFCSL